MPAKGQTLSVEAIERMKKNKALRLKSKYKWELIEPYLDVKLDMSSRNRSKKFITLREFRDHIENGSSLKEINKITSKHLVQFYSNFAQGKIVISKEDFEKEYRKGLSLEEIAEKHNISREDITYLRQLYGQKNRGATYINRKKTEQPLTKRQKEVLYGSMLGDAYKMSSSAVGFKHCSEQKDYILWKYNEFKSAASPNSLQKVDKIDKRSESEITTWKFYTYANSDVEKCISEFYHSGQKEVSFDILEKLTPLSIAVWYMDDGTTDFNHRSIVSSGKEKKPLCNFCTDSFSKESCENIKKWFKDKYDINVSLKNRTLSNRIGYRIQVDVDSVGKFIELIRPHILPMFVYKIDYRAYKNRRKDKETRVVGAEVLQCPLGADFSNLGVKDQDDHIDDIVYFYQSNGIESLIERPNKWENHMFSVIKANPENIINDDCISFSNLGNKFLMSHFPNFWEAKAKGGKSPKEVFNSKEYLSDIVRKIVLQGYFPSQDKILKALQRYRGNKQVSGFMPCVAKSIYHKYCKEESRVLDFCAGYGGRLFGAMACNKVTSYTCSEINFKTCSNLHDLYRTLRIYAEIEKQVVIYNQDSLLAMSQFADKSFDFCFTSPPYFDAELYEEDASQSCEKYPRYSEWLEEFLIKSIVEARRISDKVAINIANTGGYRIADDLEKWLKSENISYIIDKIRMPHYGGDFRYEPIFVF